jgi:cobalt/nickel transport system permease protein
MHIPDGFLSAPVWATLDVAAVPAVAWAVRSAQKAFDESGAPLLGVMGAFVFAAQMINFPVGAGTSGHLVGGALLAYILGPCAASVVMTAIIAIQALIFQDGGVLALGANVLNMALLGVLAGYLPYHLSGSGKWRNAAVFCGAALSVLVSAVLALAELRLSGIAIAPAAMGVSLALFAVSGLIEGAITLAVVQALRSFRSGVLLKPAQERSYGVAVLGGAAVLLAVTALWLASTHPDGIEKLVQSLGMTSRAKALMPAPLADYDIALAASPWIRKAAAGLTGLALVFGACLMFGRAAIKRRSD